MEKKKNNVLTTFSIFYKNDLQKKKKKSIYICHIKEKFIYQTNLL